MHVELFSFFPFFFVLISNKFLGHNIWCLKLFSYVSIENSIHTTRYDPNQKLDPSVNSDGPLNFGVLNHLWTWPIYVIGLPWLIVYSSFFVGKAIGREKTRATFLSKAPTCEFSSSPLWVPPLYLSGIVGWVLWCWSNFVVYVSI